MIKRPFLSAFGYHSDEIGRYSFTLRGRLRFKVAGGYARPHKRGRARILNILKVTCRFFPPLLFVFDNKCSQPLQSRCVQSVGVFALKHVTGLRFFFLFFFKTAHFIFY